MVQEPSRETKRNKDQILAIWIAIGAGAGIALGYAMDNLAIWTAIGVGMGVVIGVLQPRM